MGRKPPKKYDNLMRWVQKRRLNPAIVPHIMHKRRADADRIPTQGRMMSKRERREARRYRRSAHERATMPYYEYLKTKYWRQVRSTVFKRDGYLCVWCKSDTTLQAHHITYEHRGRELENDNIKDLLTLCRLCHEGAHEIGEGATGRHLPMVKEFREIVSAITSPGGGKG